MALLRNGTVLNQYPLRQVGGGVHADITMFGRGDQRNIYSGITDLKSGIPNGHVAPSSWLLPLKPGGMSSFNYAVATFAATGAALMGVTSPATSSITFAVDGTGSLITSGTGSASFSITPGNPDLLASLSGDGTATFTISGAALLDGHGFMNSTTSMAITGTLVAYATGSMSGSTLNGAAMSEASITSAVWGAIAANYNSAGTMGSKLNSAASGGVDYGSMAYAVRTELQDELLRIVDLAKVHGLVVGTDLVVTPTSRTAGSIVQTINTVGSTTTVSTV